MKVPRLFVIFWLVVGVLAPFDVARVQAQTMDSAHLDVGIWIEKGLGMVVTGFVPNPLGVVTEYWPTFPELMISLGVYGIGVMTITLLYKISLSVRGQVPR